MIGNIIKPNGIASVNPDDLFVDPSLHIASEDNFIELLENGVYDSKYIGYKVRLSNTVDYNDGLWIIADVNHDSANTGQTNCYDLISQDSFHIAGFGNNQNWRNSNVRTWLNSTFYSGFSNNFKSHILNLKYNSQETSWYDDDKIIIPSYVEIAGYDGGWLDVEGVKYPIFTDYASRIKKIFNDNAYYWWLRTRNLMESSWVRCIDTSGNITSSSYSSAYPVAPILRVS